jgi:hypothetical protein
MKLFYVLILALAPLTSLFSQDCKLMPAHFTSYNAATAWVKKASFKFTDNVNTSKSSWIRSASYYSCDGKTGFFIFSTDDMEYIHANMPVSIWNEFKHADSFGKYYNLNIKHRYQYYLN